MQFLKILFWCLLAFVAAAFTLGNWTSVPVRLPGGLIAEINLPLLLLVAFLVGWLPTHLYHLARRWRLTQRLNASERQLAEVRTVVAPPPPPVIVTPEPVVPSTLPREPLV